MEPTFEQALKWMHEAIRMEPCTCEGKKCESFFDVDAYDEMLVAWEESQ
jgi:hypothetical protein